MRGRLPVPRRMLILLLLRGGPQLLSSRISARREALLCTVHVWHARASAVGVAGGLSAAAEAGISSCTEEAVEGPTQALTHTLGAPGAGPDGPTRFLLQPSASALKGRGMGLKDVAQAGIKRARLTLFIYGKHITLLEAAFAPRVASRPGGLRLLPGPCSPFQSSSLLATYHRSRPRSPVLFWILLLLCVCMNFLLHGPQCDKVPTCSPCPLQTEALGNLTSKVVIFVLDLSTMLAANDWEAPRSLPAFPDDGKELSTSEELECAPLVDTPPWLTHSARCRGPADVAGLFHTSGHLELHPPPHEQWEPPPLRLPPVVTAPKGIAKAKPMPSSKGPLGSRGPAPAVVVATAAATIGLVWAPLPRRAGSLGSTSPACKRVGPLPLPVGGGMAIGASGTMLARGSPCVSGGAQRGATALSGLSPNVGRGAGGGGFPGG